MGRESTDFDFSTPLDPELIEQSVRAAGRRPYLMGKRFGTVAFRLEGLEIEVTTFRSERYRPGSRQPRVEFLPDLAQDLGRRDFTINAMALHGDELIDPFGGRADLESRLVRAVGDPVERFSEDPLRMLRAARFVSQLDFDIEARTCERCRSWPPASSRVARERWMVELDRLLVGPGVERALHLVADTGLMGYLLPEIGLQTDIADTYSERARAAPCSPTRWTLSDRRRPRSRVAGPRCCSTSPHPTLRAADSGEDARPHGPCWELSSSNGRGCTSSGRTSGGKSVKRLVVGDGGPGEE